MYLKTLSLGDIHPYERNPRINDKAVEPVMKSIEKDGYRARIIVDKDGVIIAGHTRYEAMKRLGWTEAEVWIADDMTPEQIADYRIRDNLTADFAEWDFSELEAEIAEMDLDFDMSEFEGFEDIQGGVSDTPTTEEDDFDPDEPVEPNVKLGDIYQLGRHRLMCGDSTSREDVEALMDGERADMVFTDPPYGYKYQSNMRTKTDKFDVIENDDKILDFFPLLKGIVSGFVMVCTTWKVLDKWLPLFKRYYDLSNMIIWDKGGGYIGDLLHTFGTDYEVVLCSNNGKEIKGKRVGSIWDIGKDNESSYIHPTQKPVALSAEAINHTTVIGDIVLDMFGGSGSTLIACEQTGRKCYMMELDPHYVDVIISRWENLTGEKAVLLNG